MSRKIRPAPSRRDFTTLGQDSEITQAKALAWLIRHPDDGLVEPRHFTSRELGALAEAIVEIGPEGQAEAWRDAAIARGISESDIDGAIDIVARHECIGDGELRKAVRELRSLWAARAYGRGEITPADLHRYTGPDTSTNESEIVFIRADTVEPKPVRWLWPGYIPLGKVTLFAGRPKTGKSAMLCDLAARVSQGKAMPYADPSTAVRGRVILCMAEDDHDDTVVPRLIAAGADLSMIELFKSAGDSRGERGLDITRDIAALERKCSDGEVRLIVLDPIMSFIGADTDTNSDASTRYALWPIKSLAQRFGVAVIFNHHQRKDSGGDLQAAAMGSTAFTGVPRSTLAICLHPSDKARKLVIPTGLNVGTDAPTLGYTVRTSEAIEAPAITWDEQPHADLDERGYQRLRAQEAARNAGSELHKATDFLDRVLAPGPMASKTLEELAQGEGIAERTLSRARKEVGCTRKKLADGTWMVGLEGAFDTAPVPA